jgi:hypothetical protein
VEVSGAESRQPEKVAILIEPNFDHTSTVRNDIIRNGCQDQISTLWASQSSLL